VRLIEKQAKCDALDQWKKRHRAKKYEDLDDATRRAIRTCLMDEQHGLCAFCCQALASIEHCHNEHLQAQAKHNARTLDYDNLVASCNTKRQCGDAHGSQALPLTPLMPACETELRFTLSGRVEATTERAKEAIRVLNLGDKEGNNKALIEKRKQLIDALIWDRCNAGPAELQMETPEMIELLIDDISQPEDGVLAPFAPVLVNVLRQWL
jgi:uncharacterized protein (TIGR02646 family)